MLCLFLFLGSCITDDEAGTVIENSVRTQIPDAVFEQFLVDQGIDDAVDGSVSSEAISGVEELDMTDIPVASLNGLQDFTALRKFLIRSTQLTSFDPNPNTQLRYLSTNGCVNLTSLPVNSLSLLDTLYMSNNNSLLSLDVSQNTNLKSLHVIADKLENLVLPQSETNQFIDLILLNTELTSIDLSPFEELEKVRIEDNKLGSLDLSSNLNLLEVDCSGNPLAMLNLANGSNEMLELMDARDTEVGCIQIDVGFDPPADGSWQKDAQTIYSDSCQ
jgi:hypothetical protein